MGEQAEAETLAHEIAELKLRKYCIEPMGQRAFNSRLKKLKEKPLFEEEMLKHTDTYLDYIAGVLHGFSSPPYVAAEKRIDYGIHAGEGSGTCACIILGGKILHIIHFKYGKSITVVSAEIPQLKLYALGAYSEYSFLLPIDTVKMTILQPRFEITFEYCVNIPELLEWDKRINTKQ